MKDSAEDAQSLQREGEEGAEEYGPILVELEVIGDLIKGGGR